MKPTYDELLNALRELVQRVDTTPIEDGSNLDTCHAHALIERADAAKVPSPEYAKLGPCDPRD